VADQALSGSLLPLGVQPGDFLVGGKDCGRGSRPGTAAVLLHAGVAAVIATSIDADFFAEALEVGLPAVAIEEAAAIKSGDRLRLDIEIFRVANRNSGDRYIIKNLNEEARECLRRAVRDE
jgi:3-isopropylmalate/(R)-2-methylmalate dehydratase small subunit